MVSRYGASAKVQALVRHHQDALDQLGHFPWIAELQALQRADSQN